MNPSQPPLVPRQGQARENRITNHRGTQCQDYYGDKIRKKQSSVTRLLLCNPNGLTGIGRNSKMELLKKKTLAYRIDALCMVEEGQNLLRTPLQKQLRHSTNGWWEHKRSSQAYNRHFDSGKESQIGGVSITVTNSLAHRSTNIESDPTGLGRWTSILIQGKKGFNTRIVCAYRPCKSYGPETAYIQHSLYYSIIGRRGDPRKLFMDDLANAITTWSSKGERIIVVGDFNTGDKQTTSQQQKFWQTWLKKTALIDVHLSRANLASSMPSTHERDKVRIDYMFVSAGITIRKAGFLPFSKLPGDHRALWMDIDTKDIIGYKPPPLTTSSARKLKLLDPHTVTRYLHSLTQSIEENQLISIVDRLSTIPPDKWIPENTQEYEKVAQKLRQSMIEAESTCRKFHTGSHPWSPELSHARKTKFYWELMVKHLLGLHVPKKRLVKLKKQLKIKGSASSITLAQALSSQTLARKEYSRVKRHSFQLPRAFRERLAHAIASEKNIKQSSAYRALINREETREMHRRIRWMRNKYQGLSTSGVLITTGKAHKSFVSDKDTLEKVIIQENERKFHQTEGQCPLTEGQLLHDIGLCATGPSVPDILSGSYKFPSGTTKSTRAFLQACSRPQDFNLPSLDHLSFQHYKKSWNIARESTGSGKVHFGHWKAGILDDVIGTLQWRMTILPSKHGFSPRIWQQATDVMILKKAGVLDLEKLRTIVLYEADYNFFNTCIGRQVMDNAIHNGYMADEQYAKPGVSAQDQCLTRRLIFDFVRFTRQSLAMASSDLKSCYDRIVHSAASLAMQKCGIQPNTVKVMFDTIQKCEHTIRTAYGASTHTYGGKGSYTLPVMGVGQGNGAGPQMWAVISAVLFLAMHMEGFSTPFCQKMTQKFLSLTGFMYVDDMDLICIGDGIDDDGIIEELQLMLGYWNKLVRVTGGALEPNKSGWYSFSQRWNSVAGRYEYVDKGTFGDIKTYDDKKRVIPLQHHSVHTSQEMLGVKMCPTGDFYDQLLAMKDISSSEAALICQSNISETDLWHAIKSSIFPRLSWPLPCMSISLRESKQLLRPILDAALPKLHIVSTLGYDYIHGSAAFQGLGLPELYHAGYSKQLEMLVDHLWKQTHTGHFIQIVIQEFILEAGSMQPLFCPDRNSRLSSWLLTQNTWINSLRTYVLDNCISVNLTIPTLQLPRQHDIAIMDVLDKETSFTSLELRDINICRIYKKALFLSDISSGDGRTLAEQAATDTPITRSSTFPFVRQDYPSPRQWQAWQKAISFIRQTLQTKLQPLGEWIMDDNQYYSQWDYFYDPIHQLLYHRSTDGSCTVYPRQQTRTRHCIFSCQGTLTTLPDSFNGCLRTTIKKSHGTLRTEGGKGNTNIYGDQGVNDSLPPIERFKHLCQKFPDASWAMQHIEMTPTIGKLLHEFTLGQTVMVGDGSYDDSIGLGAGACIVSTTDETEYIIVGGPTPGPRATQSAYRSELGTMVAMGILSHVLATITNSHPSVTVSCDNDTALERPFSAKQHLNSRQHSFDLLSLAHDIWEKSTVSPIPTKVRGHADALSQPLTLTERLNCRMDATAKEYLRARANKPITRKHDPSFGMPTILFQGENITDRLSSSVQEHQALSRSKQVNIRHQRVTEDTWTLIDHRALTRSSHQMSTYKKTFVTKWVSKQLPIGACLVRQKYRVHDTCPICLTSSETMCHLTTCPAMASKNNYHKALEGLSTWMQSMDTDPVIQHHLISTLSHLRNTTSITRLPYPCVLTNPAYYETFRDQGRIGWKQFTEGLLSSKWSLLQQEHYQQIGQRRSGITWATKLIVQLWEVNCRIWTFRNEALHSHDNLLHNLHGDSHLDTAIHNEFQQGHNGLSPQIAAFYRQHSEAQLMTKTIEYKLHWFRTIRMAREAEATALNDEFSTNGPLRQWVRLPPL